MSLVPTRHIRYFWMEADPTYHPKASVFGKESQKSMYLQIGPVVD